MRLNEMLVTHESKMIPEKSLLKSLQSTKIKTKSKTADDYVSLASCAPCENNHKTCFISFNPAFLLHTRQKLSSIWDGTDYKY